MLHLKPPIIQFVTGSSNVFNFMLDGKILNVSEISRYLVFWRKRGTKKPHDQKKPKQRFGEIAVEKGYISPEQLSKALYVQRLADRRIDKRPHLIGEILYELRFMKNSKIKKVIKFMIKAQNS